MVSILSKIVEFRNGESGLHVEHINKLSGMLLERLVQKTDKYHLTWTDQYLITVASALHDIGKIGIDEKILNKPGKLTPEEFEKIQEDLKAEDSVKKETARAMEQFISLPEQKIAPGETDRILEDLTREYHRSTGS